MLDGYTLGFVFRAYRLLAGCLFCFFGFWAYTHIFEVYQPTHLGKRFAYFFQHAVIVVCFHRGLTRARYRVFLVRSRISFRLLP